MVAMLALPITYVLRKINSKLGCFMLDSFRYQEHLRLAEFITKVRLVLYAG
jgi:hypothetical protein